MNSSAELQTGKLGFGLMRLPKKGFSVDLRQMEQMVDEFLEAGFTYFDTAYVYTGSEEAAQKALVRRHPRGSYTLATKLHAGMASGEKGAKEEFYTSLKRSGAEYFDYYLLHSLMQSNYRTYDRYHLWEFVRNLKEKGQIRHLGFSFHDGPELLDQILSEHPEVEFVQLQINYADWENPSVTSRKNYEVARKHGKPIVVMEPVKGGSLASPSWEIRQVLEKAHPGLSPAGWAIRFAAGLEGILTVLSGMSSLEQMRDNLQTMKNFAPLSEEETKAIQQVQRLMGRSATIPCTACHYCTDGCPMQIPIPEIFAAMNLRLGSGQLQKAQEEYVKAILGRGSAGDCIACGQCEKACPQHISIIKELEKCADSFDR